MSAAIIADGVGKSYGSIPALKSATFRVEAGQVFAIIGPNGAGKTTIFNLVSRINDPTSGTIVFNGQDITRIPANKVASLGIARTFQNIELFDNASVLQNMMVGRHIHIATNLFSEIFRLPSVARKEME